MTANGDIKDNKESSPNEMSDGSDLIKKELFLDILEKDYGICQIINFTVKKCSGGGENYMSWMFSAKIDIETEDGARDSVSYIVKMMPPNDPQGSFKKELNAFSKEVEMYEDVVPKFEQFLRENNVDTTFGPKYFKSFSEPYEIFIMEDLKSRNFENIDRLKGMDMEHTKMVLTKLAQFHAASACIYEKSGPHSEQLMKSLFAGKEVQEAQISFWNSIVKCLRLWKTCQEYVDCIESLLDKIVEMQIELFAVDPTEFNVLLHGDLWSNNIMFQHDENGSPKDVLLVDLQIARYGSPIHDLMYFIISSTEYSIKVKEFDYLIKFYHTELIKNLNLLKYPKEMPTLVDFQVAVVKKSFIGIITCFGVMSAALLDPNEKAEMSHFIEDNDVANDFKRLIYTNPRLIKHCEILLPFLANKGALEG